MRPDNSVETPDHFKGRFRIQSSRLPGWDYTSDGYYFVTICTKDRVPCLSEIVEGSVHLSSIGEIVASEWRAITVRRRDVSLDEWVVMPNHIHGIVMIHRQLAVETPQRAQTHSPIYQHTPLTRRDDPHPIQRGVSTGSATSIASRLQAGSLGAMIGQFKSRSTKRLWRSGFPDFGWQPRFFDHIIRDDRSLDRIRQYIIDNPTKWDSQEAITENLWM